MARIRTIKPEFWTSEQVMGLNPITRLLFIGMWNFADDYGRMPFAPATIKARVMPMDQVSVHQVRDMILELDSAGLIIIYSAQGKEYIEVTGWSHQKIDRPHKPRFPSPYSDDATIIAEPSTNIRRSDDEPSSLEGKGSDVLDDDDEDARAPEPLISPDAVRLADEIAVICGHDLEFVPPAWNGAAYRVQFWLSQGWPEGIILASCREQIAKKRDGPPDRINYFEKGIASAIAKANAPLPKVKIIEGETIEVKRNGATENLSQVARRLATEGIGFGPKPSLIPGGEGGGDVVRMLPARGRERS